MKKIFFIILLSFLSQNVFAYDFGKTTSGYVLYYDYNDGVYGSSVTLVDGTDLPANLTIPNQTYHNGRYYSVTAIGGYAFSGDTMLTSVTIPSSVTSIGNSAFSNCTGLSSITIPSSVTSIGNSAFYNCIGLSLITIPNSVTSIGYNAFWGCTGLTTVNYNAVNSVSSVSPSSPESEAVFRGCTNITTFNFGNSVTNIPSYLCYGLNLTSVTIPNSVTSIGSDAFCGCTGLTSVNYNAISCVSAGTYYHLAFRGCTNISTFNFGSSVTNIPSFLCYGLNLTSVTIPNSVTSIGNSAFRGCVGLSSLVIPNSVTSIGARAFYGCTGMLSIALPNSLINIGNAAFYNCTGLTSVTIPNSVISIGDSGFSGCTGVRLLEFNADSCIYMGSLSGSSYGYARAIFYNTDIRTINIGGNVKNIPAYAFYGCNHITSITIPELVSNIGVQAFTGCSSLDTVNLYPVVPPSVGSNTFSSSVDRFNVRCDAYTAYYSSTQWLTYRSRLRSYFYPNIEVTVSSSNPTHGTAVKVLLDGRYVSCDSLCIISATNNYGYHFDHWSNGRMSNPDTLHLTGDSNVVAYFAPNQYAVYGVPNYPDRGYVLGNDTVDYLDTVLLTAMANHGYMFDHWSDGAYENPHSVVASGNRTITAYFVPAQFTLSVISSDLNMGTVSGGGNYDYQSNRIIRAIANTGYHFTHWNDGDANNNRTITLTQDTTFTAYFAPNQYTLTLQSADESLGIVTGGGEYVYHDTVTISATAIAPHYHFDRWSDNNTENPRQYVITGNTTLTAYFALDVHSVVVQVDDLAHGTVSGGGNYAYGSAATIIAETPFSGWVFSHWSDGATYNPYTFAVLQDTVMTAYFVREGSQNDIDSIGSPNVKIYVEGQQIVAEGAEGNTVMVYDLYGRVLAIKRDEGTLLRFDAPATGTYLIRIGDSPARRVVVVR